MQSESLGESRPFDYTQADGVDYIVNKILSLSPVLLFTREVNFRGDKPWVLGQINLGLG